MSEQQQDSGRQPPFKWMGAGAALFIVVLFAVAMLSTGGGQTEDSDAAATATEPAGEPQPSVIDLGEDRIREINERLETLAGELLRTDLALSELGREVADIRERSGQDKDLLSDLQRDMERISKSVEELRVSGAEASDAISAAAGRIGSLERHQRRAAQTVAPPPRPSGRLLTVDTWDGKPYVLIETTGGQTIWLRPGDAYDGWRLVSAGKDGAVFEQGGRTATLYVSGG